MYLSFIEWCFHTINLHWGCTKVTKGCDNCYAESESKRRGKKVWGNDVPRTFVSSAFANLDKFQRIAESKGEYHSVFCGSMMDIFEKPMPLVYWSGKEHPMNTGQVRDEFFQKITDGLYPNLIFLLLTKRPSNINKYIPASWKTSPPENVMYGTSPVDQKTYDTLVSQLMEVNGKRFLSVEPQLEPIQLPFTTADEISWIIQGGESGRKKRPFNLEWARTMRDQCRDMGLPYFFKQIDKVQEIPVDLMIRQFPECLQKNNF